MDEMTLDEFFEGREESRTLFGAVRDALPHLGPVEMRVTKSQIAFRHRTGFAAVWIPEMYLGDRGAPLVLTVYLRRRDPSPRWKEAVEAAPGRFTHHLEVRAADEIDDEVRRWLAEAWEGAA